MTIAPASPPLFVQAFRQGRLVSTDVIDDRIGPDPELAGDIHCVVKAPNGASAEGPVRLQAADGPRAAYAKFATLLADRHRISPDRTAELWIDAGSDKKSSPAPGRDMWVSAWSGGRCLEGEEWTVEARDWGGVDALSMSSSGPAIDHVMFWADRTPPLVVRWSPTGSFVIARSATGLGTVLRPVALGDGSLASAYWGFTRSNLVEAADIVGRRAYVTVASGGDRSLSLMAAAHWAYQFDAPAEYVQMLVRHLGGRPEADLDAAIMGWLLSFTSDPDLPSESLAAGFKRIIESLRTTEPLLTETFRLLVQKLGGALRFFDGIPEHHHIREGVGWARRLAAATYWDTELTSYRASRPGCPDPSVIAADVASAAKKKSARFRSVA